MIFKFKYEILGGHTHFSVYAGMRPGALGKCGDLVMRNEEFDAFKEVICQGSSSKHLILSLRRRNVAHASVLKPYFSGITQCTVCLKKDVPCAEVRLGASMFVTTVCYQCCAELSKGIVDLLAQVAHEGETKP